MQMSLLWGRGLNRKPPAIGCLQLCYIQISGVESWGPGDLGRENRKHNYLSFVHLIEMWNQCIKILAVDWVAIKQQPLHRKAQLQHALYMYICTLVLISCTNYSFKDGCFSTFLNFWRLRLGKFFKLEICLVLEQKF